MLWFNYDMSSTASYDEHLVRLVAPFEEEVGVLRVGLTVGRSIQGAVFAFIPSCACSVLFAVLSAVIQGDSPQPPCHDG